MAIRIKSKWSKTVKRKKTPEDYGSALSFISWRLSLDKAKTLHGEDFEYENDHQRVSIIVEYMSFQVHLVDRLLFEDKTDDEFRNQVMNSLVNSHLELCKRTVKISLAQEIIKKDTSTL